MLYIHHLQLTKLPHHTNCVQPTIVANLFCHPKFEFEFLFHEDSQYSGVSKYCGVYLILRCLSKKRLYTKLLKIHFFSTFIIKTSPALTRDDTDKLLQNH